MKTTKRLGEEIKTGDTILFRGELRTVSSLKDRTAAINQCHPIEATFTDGSEGWLYSDGTYQIDLSEADEV